jgi:hypothetical protein
MQRHYFELNKVESITLTYEKELSYQWYDEIPASPRTFLGIQFGTKPLIPAGWNDMFDDDGTEFKRYRKQSSYFADYPWYRISKVDKKIYNKAHVTVYLSYKHSLGVHFESTEKAQAYVDSLIESSDKRFHVIINK